MRMILLSLVGILLWSFPLLAQDVKLGRPIGTEPVQVWTGLDDPPESLNEHVQWEKAKFDGFLSSECEGYFEQPEGYHIYPSSVLSIHCEPREWRDYYSIMYVTFREGKIPFAVFRDGTGEVDCKEVASQLWQRIKDAKRNRQVLRLSNTGETALDTITVPEKIWGNVDNKDLY